MHTLEAVLLLWLPYKTGNVRIDTTLRCIRITIFAMDKQGVSHILCVYL